MICVDGYVSYILLCRISYKRTLQSANVIQVQSLVTFDIGGLNANTLESIFLNEGGQLLAAPRKDHRRSRSVNSSTINRLISRGSLSNGALIIAVDIRAQDSECNQQADRSIEVWH